MDPTVSHRRLSSAFVAVSTNSSFDGYKRSKQPRCAKVHPGAERGVALNRVLSSGSSCGSDVRAHPLCSAEPRPALFMLGALTLSPSFSCFCSSCLLLELPSPSRNIRSRQLYQSANFLIKPLSARGRYSQEISEIDHHDPAAAVQPIIWRTTAGLALPPLR